MDKVKIPVRLNNTTLVNSKIVVGRPARYYVMNTDHLSPIAGMTTPISVLLSLLTKVVAYQHLPR
jgi:hypothetical protein